MTVNLPESRVLKIWQDCPGRDDLQTEDDGPVKVLYPGRLNDGSGADFRDAVIETAQGRLTGDIEIHSRSSDWRAHRHHLDPLYNRVILHVVFRHDTEKSIVLENGNSAPTLALEKLYGENGGKHYSPPLPATPCRQALKLRDALPEALDRAGEQRFRARAAGFQASVSPEEAGQALYRGIMGALGYSQNKHPMMALACRMPLQRLESMVTAATPDAECLLIYQAMLLGAAGLLPSQRGPETGENGIRAAGLEKAWASCGDPQTMFERDWQFFRVRPGNFPTRRITAMSRLLLRYRWEGLLRGLTGKLDSIPADEGHRALEDALIIEGENGNALLGKDRAADIVINILLPFAAAWGRANSRPELAEKAVDMYFHYPALATNTIERHMRRQLGIGGKPVGTARRQQGLLHIFKTWCSVGGCQDCPVLEAV